MEDCESDQVDDLVAGYTRGNTVYQLADEFRIYRDRLAHSAETGCRHPTSEPWVLSQSPRHPSPTQMACPWYGSRKRWV